MTGRNEKLIIGQRLRVLRQSLGLTQAQMAAELGVSASYVTLIEADQRQQRRDALLNLGLAGACQLQRQSHFVKHRA